MGSISVVINTQNEEQNLPRAIASVKSLADEIVVCDMESSDKTKEIAEKLGARVYDHKPTGYVEPARNYAVSKATKEWILILDADETVPPSLVLKIKKIIKDPKADYYRIPRKNLIFGKWMQHTLWWPDYQTRLFKKGKVSWNEIIHSVPMTVGKGEDLLAKEELAICHNNYKSIDQYLSRMHRYTSIQATFLIKEKYKFIWKDLISKPTKEFIRRYFMGEGYKDGLHGLVLSLLQATSELILYLKVWQEEKFQDQMITPGEIVKEVENTGHEINWWLTDLQIKTKGFFGSLKKRLERRFGRNYNDKQ